MRVSIAINPADPDNLIVVSRASDAVNGRRSASFHYVSNDRGATWRTLQTQNPDNRVQGDDAVAFTADGVAHHSFIAFSGLRDERPTDPNTGIFVARSPDGGATWNDLVAVVDHRNTITPFEDKPYLSVDRLLDSPHRGNVYVAWTRFDVYGSDDPSDHSHIFLSHSSDGGRSFSAPLRVSDEPGDALDSDGTVEGAVPAVGVGGEVYLVWAGPSGLGVRHLGRRRMDVRQRPGDQRDAGRMGHRRRRVQSPQRHAGDRSRSEREARSEARCTSTGSMSGTAIPTCS